MWHILNNLSYKIKPKINLKIYNKKVAIKLKIINIKLLNLNKKLYNFKFKKRI
jgi:hypothetical protein